MLTNLLWHRNLTIYGCVVEEWIDFYWLILSPMSFPVPCDLPCRCMFVVTHMHLLCGVNMAGVLGWFRWLMLSVLCALAICVLQGCADLCQENPVCCFLCIALWRELSHQVQNHHSQPNNSFHIMLIHKGWTNQLFFSLNKAWTMKYNVQ